MEILVREIVDWMAGVEASASRIYEKAADRVVDDPELSDFLRNLSNEEKEHLGIIRKAAQEIENIKASLYLISLYNEIKNNVDSFFSLCEEKIDSGTVAKKDIIDCVVSIEFSEYNHIFLYVIKSLEHHRGEFISAGKKLDQHRSKIESFLTTRSEANEYADMIRPLPPLWQKKFLNMNDDEIISGLTEQLLSFGKEGSALRERVSIRRIIENAASLTIRGKELKCDLSISAELSDICADPAQINQAVHNVVINVVHAMPEGGTIVVRAGDVELSENNGLLLDAGKYVKFSVGGKGVECSADQLPKIFDPYFTTKDEESGIELATSYLIVKHHGGHIDVESNEGEGTVFVIYLPVSEQAAPV